MRKVPELRFAGFAGEWEECRLSNLVKINSGRDYKHLGKGIYPVYGTGGLMTHVNEFLSDEDSVGIGRKGTINKPQKLEAPFWTVDTLFYATPIKDYNLDYIYSVFQRINWLKYDESSGLPSLSKTNINNIKVYNAGVQEQEKIGNLFKKLDDLIEIQEGKISKMEDFKKSMLQKTFPKKGELVPEFRFAGFDGEWEERDLGSLSNIVRGASPRPIADPKWFDDNSDIGWLRISDVTTQNGRIYELEQKLSVEGQKKTRVYKTPHLILSIAASVGKPVINYINIGVHDGFLIFEDPKFDLEYMFQWLDSIQLSWSKYGQPGSQVNLNSDIVKNRKIILTNLEEQEKIGQFFKKLDTQIENEERLLDSYKMMKKSLLQKMFV